MADPADLSNLRDLAMPAEVSLWPPAPGWWILAAAVVVSAALLIVMTVRHHRRNAYRREALQQLETIEAANISGVLKRAALAAWPRAEVAPLSGPTWLAFLDRTGRMASFVNGPGQTIEAMTFGASVPPIDIDAARAAARAWLHRHRP